MVPEPGVIIQLIHQLIQLLGRIRKTYVRQEVSGL